MSRRANSAEPAFGTDSFLDVTANLVGVLIVFIVLIGMRVRKVSAPPAEIEAEVVRRLSTLQVGIDELAITRLRLEQQLQEFRGGLKVKHEVLARTRSGRSGAEDADRMARAELEAEQAGVQKRESELADVQTQLVSLSQEFVAAQSAPVTTRKLAHRSPIAQTVNCDELHLELIDNHVTFVDLSGLLDRVRVKCRSMEADLRARGRVSSEAGPVGPFQLRFTAAREDIPFSQSMFYTSNSFHAKLVDWQVIPVDEQRGELVDRAVQADSQLDRLLAQHSHNNYAITLWTYTDSFSAFRRLRDHLSDRGYAVAARPLPLGVPIRGSAYGSRSVAQ